MQMIIQLRKRIGNSLETGTLTGIAKLMRRPKRKLRRNLKRLMRPWQFYQTHKSESNTTWDLVWMICRMEWEEVDSEECRVECHLTWVVCQAVLAEWLLTLKIYSKCLWVDKWEAAWMIQASKVSWDEVVEVEAIHSVEWVDFNSKDGVPHEDVVVDGGGLHLTCEE